MSMSAAGTLLWMTHTLLQEHHWTPMDQNRLEGFAGDVNLLPAHRYKVSGEENIDIYVRALLVNTKLFVHFVSCNKSVQLSLKIAEFVKPREQKECEDKAQGRVLYTEKWRCNLEILHWRLNRNLFPEFLSELNLVASDAELSRLPEPLLVRVGEFLNISDFCRLTETSKYLHQLQDSSGLWEQFLRRDFPTLSYSDDNHLKTVYRTHWLQQTRIRSLDQRLLEHQLRLLRQQAPWRWRGGRLPIHPLHFPIPPPFQPFGNDSWPPRPPRHPRLLGEDDLDLFRDPFYFNLPHYY